MKFNPFTGRYLFHLHTRFTDGQLSVKDHFDYASRSDVKAIIFLEHIRREPSYDVEEFVAQVEECANAYKVQATVGFEAKLFPDGSLDISDKHLALARVIGLAEHSFPNDSDLLQAAFVKAVDTYRSLVPDKLAVWVHPGLWFKKRGLMPSNEPVYLSMLGYAQSAGMFIERNLRHGLITEQMMQNIMSNQIVIGADVHSLEAIKVWREAVGLGSSTSALRSGASRVKSGF